MTTNDNLTIAERLNQLLQHLEIEQAHVAARASDWPALAQTYPRRIASLTLMCPNLLDLNLVGHLEQKLLVFTGQKGEEAEPLRANVAAVAGSSLISLDKFAPWSDVVADNVEQVSSFMIPFLVRTAVPGLPELNGRQGEQGQIAGITYTIEGSGPPLLLFPIGLIPSQWEPLVPRLAEQFCTITLGGDKLGMVALLEERSREAGYLGMVRYLMEEAHLQPGETVLEVGCGTGALVRFLTNYTGGQNPITAVDINTYLLREAATLAQLADMAAIKFQHGNAEKLPYPDNSFDITFSATVMEEVDADQMLAEMVRVTRPGGRVAVIVRALDVPFSINLPLSAELKARVEDPTSWAPGVGPKGCADASLYRRFQESPLTGVKMYPFLATFSRPVTLSVVSSWIQEILTPQEAEAWQTARAQGELAGTLFFSWPHHCAVGTKPD